MWGSGWPDDDQPVRNSVHQILWKTAEFLDRAATLTPVMPSGLVFPSQRGKAIGDARLSGVLQQLGIGAVPHGFRSSFRDWASERTDHPREVIDAALAHVVRNQTEAAYARSDLFERRRLLMDDWAAYVGRQRDSGHDVQLLRRRLTDFTKHVASALGMPEQRLQLRVVGR